MVDGSIPSIDLNMESCQSGLLWDFAKVLGVKAPQVQILYFPPYGHLAQLVEH